MKKTLVVVVLTVGALWTSYSLGVRAGTSLDQPHLTTYQRLPSQRIIFKDKERAPQIEKSEDKKEVSKNQKTSDKKKTTLKEPLLAENERNKKAEGTTKVESGFQDFMQPETYEDEVEATDDTAEFLRPDESSVETGKGRSLLENEEFHLFVFYSDEFSSRIDMTHEKGFKKAFSRFRQENNIPPSIIDEEFTFTISGTNPSGFIYNAYTMSGEHHVGSFESSSHPNVSEEALVKVHKATYLSDTRRLVLRSGPRQALARQINSFFEAFTSPLPYGSYVDTDHVSKFDIFQINPDLLLLQKI
jgi:hypothetical protein